MRSVLNIGVWGAFSFVLIFLGKIKTVEARWDLIPGSRYTSGRAAGMGEAYLPLGDDAGSGLFYNPANLGRIRKSVIEPINLSISGNGDFLSTASLDFYKVSDLGAYQSVLEQNVGKMPGAGMALLPSITFPGFAFGILLQGDVAAQMNSDRSVTYRSLYQVIPALGWGHRFFDGVIRVGYSVQWVNQAIGNPTVTDLSYLSYNRNLSQGSALSHNLGIAIAAPYKFSPAINFVARNIMNTRFIGYTPMSFIGDSSGIPSEEPMTFDGSFSVGPRLGLGVGMNLVIEQRDILNKMGVDLMGHLAGGLEFSFRDKVFLRGGWRGGYPSFGFGMKRQGAEMSLAWFTEEIGGHYLASGESRLMLQYQFRTY